MICKSPKTCQYFVMLSQLSRNMVDATLIFEHLCLFSFFHLCSCILCGVSVLLFDDDSLIDALINE